ncbi:MAG: hypothetical protein CMP84_16160 [Gammaproteobacteria bacterium]|nr:hypothetical protein [Gammaproteobacteria bacterium]
MALTEKTEEDKIEIVGEFKHVQVRTATIILKDNKEISRSFHRRVIDPGADTSSESAEVKGICAAVHTETVVNAYKVHLEANKPGG